MRSSETRYICEVVRNKDGIAFVTNISLALYGFTIMNKRCRGTSF